MTFAANLQNGGVHCEYSYRFFEEGLLFVIVDVIIEDRDVAHFTLMAAHVDIDYDMIRFPR
jgi:hypothetical protein